jgi:hypothetical protein
MTKMAVTVSILGTAIRESKLIRRRITPIAEYVRTVLDILCFSPSNRTAALDSPKRRYIFGPRKYAAEIINANDSKNSEYSKNSRSEREAPESESISPQVQNACPPRTKMHIIPIRRAADAFFILA